MEEQKKRKIKCSETPNRKYLGKINECMKIIKENPEGRNISTWKELFVYKEKVPKKNKQKDKFEHKLYINI